MKCFLNKYGDAFYSTLLFLFLCSFTCCQAQNKNNKESSFYHLNQPDQVINLPKEISQISGIAYSKDNSVYAIDDDHGTLYQIPLTTNPDVKTWHFGKPNDYEDIVLAGNTFYVLASKGAIVSFPAAFPIKEVQNAELPLKGNNEFEILYHDPERGQLVMVCKDCKEDKHETTAFGFNLANHTFEKKPAYVLQRKDIEKVLGDKIARFKPSAATIHPLTGELYIVSSINKLIVVLNKSHQVVAVYPLNDKLFKQPEGIAFTPSGDMIISNEFAHAGAANLLIFKKK